MTDQISQYVNRAKDNRRKYLESERVKFELSENKKKRAEQIIKLMKLEPSHILEPWIAEELIKWMRERDREYDLEKAFVLKKNRTGREIKRTRETIIRQFFLYEEIERICASNRNYTKKQAFFVLSELQADTPNPLFPMHGQEDKDIEGLIKKDYFAHQSRIRTGRFLPHPYWGLDVYESRENNELVISAHNVKVQYAGDTFFGKWTYHPISGIINFSGHIPHKPGLKEKYEDLVKNRVNLLTISS